ncbi:MAG: hypothetical protein IK092_05055, partial [Muribaculaceae bacterium]|nr:hypothetical protein [Muribaculaceae bacterium]
VRVHLTKGEHTFKVTSLSSQWVFDGIRITPAQDEPIAQSQYNEPTWDTESDTWVAVDGLGRKVADSDDITRQIDNEAKIGMFYYVWHGQHGYEYKDNTKFMEANPASPPFGPIGAYHWSGEPALGYYAGGNPYVIAKHMQMLVDAGVDFYFFDVTNSYTYNNNVKKVIDEIDRRAALGLKTPKLVFTVNTSAADVIKNLFNTYYSNPKYDKYWFYYEGKPLMLVDKNALSGVDGNIINAFTMRKSWAFMEGKKPNEWSWLEFFPQQPGRNSEGTIEQISVSTAQHAATKVGKSYTGTRSGGSEPQLDQFGLTSRTPYGDYVEQQWQRARDVHPKIVMYTQWNEWIAIRFKFNNETFDGRSFYCPDGWSYFVDVFNQEFSRDIEPSKNSLIKDNYYMQFVSNVRKYRGVKPIAGYKQGTVINLDGNFSQWNNVTSIYRDDPGDCLYSHTTDANSITQAALDNGETNDIVLSKVAHDRYNLYFYVKTSENLNNYDSHEAWMQLYLNTDSTYSNGWNGYDFMIGKDLTTGNYALKQYNGTDNSYSWTTIGDVRRFTSGNQLYFAVPLNKLNLAGTNFHIDFKWADNLATTPDVLDFITQGDVAPNARFNYRYKAIASTDGILMGDVNCDGIVNVNDITAVVAKVLGGNPQPFNNQAADLNNDTTITVADVTAIVRLVLAN